MWSLSAACFLILRGCASRSSTARLGLCARRIAAQGRDAVAALGECRGVYPDGYGYSRYCELYTRWEGKLSPVMRQRRPAGERLFVDYAGQTVDVICPKTGEVRTARIFVATLGASNYTYVKATSTQSLSHWISRSCREGGGNLKAA